MYFVDVCLYCFVIFRQFDNNIPLTVFYVFQYLIVIFPRIMLKSLTLISYHYTGHLVLFMEHHSMGALGVFCISI